MHRESRRDGIAPEGGTRRGGMRVALVLLTLAAVTGSVGVATADSAAPPASLSLPAVTVPAVPPPPVSLPAAPTPSVSVPPAPTVTVPSVSVPTPPTPSVSVPSVSVPSSPTPTPTPSVSVPSATPPSASSPAVPTPATRAGTPAASGAPPAAAATPAGSGDPPSSGSAPSAPRPSQPSATGHGPRSRSQTGARAWRPTAAGGAEAFATGTSPRAVRRALRELRGCVPSLAPAARSLLRQRAGSANAAPRSLAALSSSLGISRAAVLRRLRRATAELRTAAQTTGCAGPVTGTQPLTAGAAVPTERAVRSSAADRLVVSGVAAHGGPSSSPHGTAAAPPTAARETGPGTGLLAGLLLAMLALTALAALASRRVGPYRRLRRRRTVTPRLYALAMRSGFRYSHVRDALVLRGIGERFGPVLVREGGSGDAAAPRTTDRERAAVGAARGPSVDRRENRQAERHAAPRG